MDVQYIFAASRDDPAPVRGEKRSAVVLLPADRVAATAARKSGKTTGNFLEDGLAAHYRTGLSGTPIFQ